MSTSGITSSLLSAIASSPTAANQFAADLNQVAQDLEGGNLSGAQNDYVTFSQDAQNGATSSTAPASGITASLLEAIASSPSSANSFVSELNQLGSDLQNGDLSSAQEDMLSLDSTALNAASAASATSSPAPSAASSAASSSQTGSMELIQAIVEAMGDGDSSAAGSAMQQLAAVSTSAAGASYLQAAGESLAAGSSSASASSSVTQTLQSLGTNGSDSSPSILNLFG